MNAATGWRIWNRDRGLRGHGYYCRNGQPAKKGTATGWGLEVDDTATKMSNRQQRGTEDLEALLIMFFLTRELVFKDVIQPS